MEVGDIIVIGTEKNRRLPRLHQVQSIYNKAYATVVIFDHIDPITVSHKSFHSGDSVWRRVTENEIMDVLLEIEETYVP